MKARMNRQERDWILQKYRLAGIGDRVKKDLPGRLAVQGGQPQQPEEAGAWGFDNTMTGGGF
jgi:hypothetical protein